jgi:hypothetical protein
MIAKTTMSKLAQPWLIRLVLPQGLQKVLRKGFQFCYIN